MESGFGSDSFDNKYRGGSRFSPGGGASTALSGIEAMGSSSMYSPSSFTYKKKSNDHDLDAFYDESSDEEESSSAEDTSSEEENSDGEEEEDDDEEEEEEETDSEGNSEEDSDVSSEEEEEEPIKPLRRK
jgi:AP-3 complex subunit beta